MKQKKTKNTSIMRLMQSRVVLVIEVAIVLFLVVAVGQEIVRRNSVQEEVSRLEQQIEQLESKNIELAEALSDMTSDNYIEKEARKKLDLQKPGESVILVPQQDNESEILVSRESAQDQVTTSNPESWWEYFFNS